MRKAIALLTFVALMLPVPLAAATAQTLTLDAAIATALRANPSYREALVAVDADAARVREARAPLGPSLTVSDAYQYQDVVAKLATPFGPLPFSPNSTNLPLLAANYTLFDGGETAARLASASATLAASQSSARSARASLIVAVSAAYFDLAAALLGADVADHAVSVAQAHVDLARRRLTAGQIPRAELLQAQADLAGKRVDALTAHNAAAIDQNRLDAVMNVELGTQHDPVDRLETNVPDLDLDELITAARERRGDLAAAELAVDASRHAVAAARAQRAPRIALAASEGNVQPIVVPGFHAQFTVGLTAVWQLFDNGYTDGRVAEAQSAVSQAQLELMRLQTDAELEVRQAYLNLQTARLQVAAAERLVSVTAENQRLAEVRYRGGVGAAIELRDAELRDDSARQSLIDALRSQRESLVSVRFAAGFL